MPSALAVRVRSLMRAWMRRRASNSSGAVSPPSASPDQDVAARASPWAPGVGGAPRRTRVNDETEATFLADWVRSPFGPTDPTAFWIGLNDRFTTNVRGQTAGAEGEWVWTDGSPTDYTHWNEAQPDNADSAGGLHLDGSEVSDPNLEHEDCGEMYSGYGGEWNDRMCSDAGYGICHFPIEGSVEQRLGRFLPRAQCRLHRVVAAESRQRGRLRRRRQLAAVARLDKPSSPGRHMPHEKAFVCSTTRWMPVGQLVR